MSGPDGWAAEESLARSLEFYCEPQNPSGRWAIARQRLCTRSKIPGEGGFTVEDRDNVSRITSGASE
ncbi:MAG: hypothetical protein R3C02_01355 [Planctomycetaceae bacterium]